MQLIVTYNIKISAYLKSVLRYKFFSYLNIRTLHKESKNVRTRGYFSKPQGCPRAKHWFSLSWILLAISTTRIWQRRFLIQLFIGSVRIYRHLAYGTARGNNREAGCFYQAQCQRRHLPRHATFAGRQETNKTD